MHLTAVNSRRDSEFMPFHKKFFVMGAVFLNLVRPFHSQFGYVGRHEFVARSQSTVFSVTLTEISHLWRRIYHQTGG